MFRWAAAIILVAILSITSGCGLQAWVIPDWYAKRYINKREPFHPHSWTAPMFGAYAKGGVCKFRLFIQQADGSIDGYDKEVPQDKRWVGELTGGEEITFVCASNLTTQ